MRQHDMYKADIDRSIEPVIKVDSEATAVQDLTEYVVTKEVRGHFDRFFRNYRASFDRPTEGIGVWISGFFGSGKSHFLKILSYLLSDKEIGGKRATEYFKDKLGDDTTNDLSEIMESGTDETLIRKMEYCAKYPAETILFNISSKAPADKSGSVILRVFARVFYELRGFLGSDIGVAKFERYIDNAGKTEQFREAFERRRGKSWTECRRELMFDFDIVADTAAEVLGMTPETARSSISAIVDGVAGNYSIDEFTDEVKEYIDARGKNFRLVFMIDEVGQYIGSDSGLMLELQTIVEDIGKKCGGRVWIIVTSQEKIDDFTAVRGDDFSKIQGRFNTRLHLSSTSVDEVVKRRLLEKNEDGARLLKLRYREKEQVLRNLISFDKGALAYMKGYKSEEDFTATFPFIPYQFDLMQDVLIKIRQHGNAGSYFAYGERNMLSGFLYAAQQLENKDENSIVPLWMFYDHLSSSLESTVKIVVDRCAKEAQERDGIEENDVRVLKLLYLIRFVDGVRSTVDNICVLMADSVSADKLEMKRVIQKSLDRLVARNFVSRSAAESGVSDDDTYTFLTDDEQEIEKEINAMTVTSDTVSINIRDYINGEMIEKKKIRYGLADFPYNRVVDYLDTNEHPHPVTLHIYTPASGESPDDELKYKTESQRENTAIFVLGNGTDYYRELERAAKINAYMVSHDTVNRPKKVRDILSEKQNERSRLEKRAHEQITQELLTAKIYINGEEVRDIRAEGKDKKAVRARIEKALARLIGETYYAYGHVREHYPDDKAVEAVLCAEKQDTFEGMDGSPNAEAKEDIKTYLDTNAKQGKQVTMGELIKHFGRDPYGWSEADVAGVTAELWTEDVIQIKYMAKMLFPSDPKVIGYLTKKTEVEKTVVGLRHDTDPTLIKNCRAFLSEYLYTAMGNIREKDTELLKQTTEVFDNILAENSDYLTRFYSRDAVFPYPGKEIVENSKALCEKLLVNRNNTFALLKAAVDMQDDLLDMRDELRTVRTFFDNQKDIFDSAAKLAGSLGVELEYFSAAEKDAVAEMEKILKDPSPYREISRLPELCRKVQTAHDGMLDDRREEVFAAIRSARARIHGEADEIRQAEIIRQADSEFEAKENAAKNSQKLADLDALEMQTEKVCEKYLIKIATDTSGTAGGASAKTAVIKRGTVFTAKDFRNESDIDDYLARVKKDLMEKLGENDVLKLI